MKLYTAQEAADILKVSKQTVWKYGREGKLKVVRFGRTVRFILEGGTNEVQGNVQDQLQGAGVCLQ